VTNGTLNGLRLREKRCDQAGDLMLAIEAGGGKHGEVGDVSSRHSKACTWGVLRVEEYDGRTFVYSEEDVMEN
jgi:hypothetical protein